MAFASWRIGDLRWQGSLTMVSAGNKAERLSSVNHTTKTIHHHHEERNRRSVVAVFAITVFLGVLTSDFVN